MSKMRVAWAGPSISSRRAFVDQLRNHESVDFVGEVHSGVDTADLMRRGLAAAVLTPVEWADVMRTIRFSVDLELTPVPRVVLEAPEIDAPLLVKAVSFGFDGAVASSHSTEMTIERLKDIVDGSHDISNEPALQDLDISHGLLSRELVFSDDVQRSICDLLSSGLTDEEISSVQGLSVQAVRNSIEATLHANSLSRRTPLAVMHASQVRIPDFI